MSLNDGIRYLKRNELDLEKWNKCIDDAPNGLVYAYSWYLDAVCDQWDAIVQGDYDAVMPLPWRKKWGIRYIYQPPFIQRLGIFSKEKTGAITEPFLQILSNSFSFIHLDSNQAFTHRKAEITTRTNLIIDLHLSYEAIAQNYAAEAVKNIRKADNRGCRLISGVAISQVIALYRAAYGALQPKLDDAAYGRLEQLAALGIATNFAYTFGIESADKELVYAALIFKDPKRIYYVLGAPSQKGRIMRAPYFFIDQMLRKYANQSLTFDFEGSDIPNVATFYKKFGSKGEYYYNIKISQLPSWVNWLKNLRS